MTTTMDAPATWRPLGSAIGRTLEWRRQGWFSRNYHLSDEQGRLYATLELSGFVRVRGVLTTAAGQWRMAPFGFFRAGVEVFGTSEDSPVATFRWQWLMRGTLEFSSGLSYRFVRRFVPDSYLRGYAFVDAEDQPVARLSRRFIAGERLVLDRPADETELSLLAGMVEYAGLAMRRRKTR